MSNSIILNNSKYIKNKDVFKIRGRWKLKKDIRLDNYTNNYELLKNLTAFIDPLDLTLKYSSNIVGLRTNNGYYIPMCRSYIEKNISEYIEISPLLYAPKIPNNECQTFNIWNYGTKIYDLRSWKTSNHFPELNNIIPNKDDSFNFLNKYTLGIEIETSKSRISSEVAKEYNFATLYDGSIYGPEYVSEVFTIDNIDNIFKFLELARIDTSYDDTCSLHIHVGNIPYSENNLLAIYSLFQRLQEDTNALIAPYKKHYKFLAKKNKDHCENLPLISDISYKKLLELFNISDVDLDNYMDRTAKWNQLGRYYSVNFLNYICRNFNSKTIELRSLQMTTDINYFMTWLIVNISIIEYAIKHSEKVLNKKEKIQLEDCIKGLVKSESLQDKILKNICTISNYMFTNKYLINNINITPLQIDNNFYYNLDDLTLHTSTSLSRDLVNNLNNCLYNYSESINLFEEEQYENIIIPDTGLIINTNKDISNGYFLSRLLYDSCISSENLKKIKYKPNKLYKISNSNDIIKIKANSKYDCDVYIINNIIIYIIKINNLIYNIMFFKLIGTIHPSGNNTIYNIIALGDVPYLPNCGLNYNWVSTEKKEVNTDLAIKCFLENIKIEKLDIINELSERSNFESSSENSNIPWFDEEE